MCKELDENSLECSISDTRSENYKNYLRTESNKVTDSEILTSKTIIEDNCKLWLEGLSDVPDSQVIDHEPDLYSFYEELCVLRNEFRKNARRSHETFSRFGEDLSDFQKVIHSLSLRLERLTKDENHIEMVSKQKLFLPIIDIYERLKRLESKLEAHADKPDEAPSNVWRRAWDKMKNAFSDVSKSPAAIQSSVREALSITLSHFEAILAEEGISRIETVGKCFDPSRMTAVEAIVSEGYPPNTIIEELSAGFMFRENVLKLANVTVSKLKELQ